MTGDQTALQLVLTGNPELYAIVLLSLEVSLSAVLLAAVIGVPIGAFIALNRFPGRESLIVILNAMMGLPPVVVGLLVYLLLSRSGPLGAFGLLFTPQAMVVAQTILVAPIIAALGAPDHRRPVGRVPGRARRHERRPAHAHRHPDLGRALQPGHCPARRIRPGGG